MPPLVSLVIPAFREEFRLPSYLPSLAEAISDLPVEILVVDDGSPMQSFIALRNKLASCLSSRVRICHYERNRGKGHALAFGFDMSQATYCAFVDADGSVEPREVKRFLSYALGSPTADMVIASRVKMLGRHVERSGARHVIGRVFATLLCRACAIPVYDSQCGLKIFKRERYLEVKTLVKDNRWTWDTQLVILFHERGWLVEEFPVSWHEVPGSKLHLIRDGLSMLINLLLFQWSRKVIPGTRTR